MKILFHKKFQKFIGKIKNKELVARLKTEVDLIIKKPSIGKTLEQPFKKYKVQSISFIHGKNSYRIAYTKQKDELVFLLIDSRENFYSKLKRVVN